MNQSIMIDQAKKVVPNINQDAWLKYFCNNLNEIDDLEWVRQIILFVEKTQEEFNAGKYRGAMFHLNYYANEKRRLKRR